jgi:hypothetical protein
MKYVKSERLKKFELELTDLEQWLKLGLVPKKDIERHKEEIGALKLRIEEEKERLHFLKENGEAEEYMVPKRVPGRSGFTDMPSIPDLDIVETNTGMTESAFDMDTEAIEQESSVIEERDSDEETAETGAEEEEEDDEEDESYFSDRNRWRRGGIKDPDADDW